MVDVSGKAATRREARARARVVMSREVLSQLERNPKGNPLEIARIAGIAGAKRTWELIPLCHPLPLTAIEVETRVVEDGIELTSMVATTAQTGVEMEALAAVAVGALTVYDMCKSLDKSIEIRQVVLLSKSGGKSGDYRRRLDEAGGESRARGPEPKP
jgi:cyclic pyranopterin phosphate synthase